MHVNELPTYDKSDVPTGCCPRFDPARWQNLELRLQDKPFVRASTRSLFHVPLNMGAVFTKTWAAIRDADAEGDGFLVLSHDESPWHAEHLFAVDQEVPGVEMVHLSGDFLTRVFEGPYSEMPVWREAMALTAKAAGRPLEEVYFFYPTCPKCSEFYGKNYVVGLAKVGVADPPGKA